MQRQDHTCVSILQGCAVDDLVPRLYMSEVWFQLSTCLGSPYWCRGSLGVRLSQNFLRVQLGRMADHYAGGPGSQLRCGGGIAWF